MDAQPPPGYQQQPPDGTPAPYAYEYGGYGQPAPPLPIPGSVRAAVGLIWAGAVLTVVGALLIPFQLDDMRAEFRRQATTSSMPRGARDFFESDDFLQFVVTVGLIFLLLELGLWVWMAVKTRQGRNWARVLGTVLGSLTVLITLLGILAGQAWPMASTEPDLLSSALSVINTLLALVIIVLLWLPDSNRWFASMRDAP